MFLHDYLLACEISMVRTQTLRDKDLVMPQYLLPQLSQHEIHNTKYTVTSLASMFPI